MSAEPLLRSHLVALPRTPRPRKPARVREVLDDGRTACPHCRGRGRQKSGVAGVEVVCEYCAGERRVTLEDARVYLAVRARSST